MVQIPLGLGRLWHMPPACLSFALLRWSGRESAAIDPVLAIMAAFGYKYGSTSAKRTITQDEFGDFGIAHVESA